MPTLKVIEKRIFSIEGFNVSFWSNGRNLRDDVVLPVQYNAQKMSKNSYTVREYKRKLARQFPGYDFEVHKKNGDTVIGQTKLSTVRDTYLDD